MKINKDKMDIGGITDEHVDRVPVSNKPKLSRKEQKRAMKKEWKVQNAAGKRNTDNQKFENLCSNDMCERPNTVLQRSSLDKSIENAVDKGSELSNGFVVKKNTDEMVTGNTRENAKIRNCDKNHNLQSTTLSSNSVKKSAHSDNNNENQGDISKTSESTLGTTSSIDICSAQAAESSASGIDSTCKKLSMTDKLYKCLFDVAQPVLCERLSRVMNGETIKNLGNYLLKHVHYFYHQKSNASNLTCQCTITGNQFCETLTRIKYHNKNDNLTESVFFHFYTKTNNGRCKECKNVKPLLNRKECLCVYGPKVKEIDYLDFNDLEFLILECDPCISEDDKLAVSKLVFVRNDIVCHRTRPRTDRELNEVWEDTKKNILSLCSSFLYKIFEVNINEIRGMTTVTKKEFEDLQKQIATFNLHFNSEQERRNHSIQDSEQAIKDHTSSEIKGNADEILGIVNERFDQMDAKLVFIMNQMDHAQGNKSNVEFNFESSSMLNEEKAVNVLSQDDDSDSHGFQIESIERKCLLLVLKASPDIFKNETTLRIAIRSLIAKIIKAGDIDTGIPSTISVEVKFNGQFMNDEEDVIRRMLSLSIKEKNKETALQGCQKEDSFAFASTSDDTATTTDYSETLEHLDLRSRKLAFDWSSSSDNVDTDKINASKYQESCNLVSTTDDTSTSPYDSDSRVLWKDFDSASSSDIEYIDNTNSFPYQLISEAVLSESIQLSTKPPSASSEIMKNTIKALENMTETCDILEVYKMRETHERNFPKEQLTWKPCTSCALKDEEIKASEEIFKEWNQMLGIHCMLCVIKDKTLQELQEVSQQHLRLIEMYKADGIEKTFFLWEHFKGGPCKICEIKNKEIEAYTNIFPEYLRYKWRGHQEGTLLQGEITKTHCLLCEIKNKQIKVFEKRILQYAQILEIYELHGIQEGTFLWEKINRNPCNLCELKDEQIRKLEKETQEHKQSMEIFKLRDAMLKTPQYNCRNCYEKDQMIIYLDRRLHETRQRVEHEKQISESSLLDDLMRLTSIDTTMDSVDEKTELKESELGSNVSSLKSGIISKSKMEQVQSKDVQGTAPGQKQKMSNQSNRILELRYAYAANSYTKEEGQKGLAIIISKDIRNLMSQLLDKRISHSRDFFGEMGFQVEYFKDGYFQDFLFNIKHGNFYCVFVMVIDFQEFNFWAMYSSLAKRFRGKPKIIMVDSAKPQYPFGNIVEEPDTLFISMHEQFIASYGQLKEFNVIDNFIAVTQCSRFTDIMEILTRINALYDRPVISFHSSFRKKFYFL